MFRIRLVLMVLIVKNVLLARHRYYVVRKLLNMNVVLPW